MYLFASVKTGLHILLLSEWTLKVIIGFLAGV